MIEWWTDSRIKSTWKGGKTRWREWKGRREAAVIGRSGITESQWNRRDTNECDDENVCDHRMKDRKELRMTTSVSVRHSGHAPECMFTVGMHLSACSQWVCTWVHVHSGHAPECMRVTLDFVVWSTFARFVMHIHNTDYELHNEWVNLHIISM